LGNRYCRLDFFFFFFRSMKAYAISPTPEMRQPRLIQIKSLEQVSPAAITSAAEKAPVLNFQTSSRISRAVSSPV